MCGEEGSLVIDDLREGVTFLIKCDILLFFKEIGDLIVCEYFIIFTFTNFNQELNLLWLSGGILFNDFSYDVVSAKEGWRAMDLLFGLPMESHCSNEDTHDEWNS